MFWPDLATAHYARATATLLTEAEVPMVTREMNLPNVPPLRPIEDFWGLLKHKQEVYRGGRAASSEQMLRSRIRSSLKKIVPSVPRIMMEGLGKRVRLADRLGAEELVH